MFCPKCGLQNANETRFCRGCGGDLSGALAVVGGKSPAALALSEKHIDLFSSGLRGLLIGFGFMIVSGLSFAISMHLGFIGLFMMAFASFFLGTGISRLVQAKAIKSLNEKRDEPAALQPGHPEYIQPARSIYETDDLASRPFSITDHTTRHLKNDE